MKTLIKNIKELVQVEDTPVDFKAGKDMQILNTIDHAFLLTEGELIVDFGPMNQFSDSLLKNEDVHHNSIHGKPHPTSGKDHNA